MRPAHLPLITVLATALAATPAITSARVLLRNDSVEPGAEIAFYPRLLGEEFFASFFEVPDGLPNYQICRVLLWIGPNGFSVFDVRIDEADEDGVAGALVWQSDLDAFNVPASREHFSAIDLRPYRILSDVRRMRVRVRHVPGFDAPPTIASDTDGITPRRNQISALMRNGNWFRDFTENLPEEGLYPRPPGDWILRLELAAPGEACPAPDAPLPDPDPDLDAGPPPGDAGPEPDAGLPRDAAPSRDAAAPRDAAGRRDAAVAPDAGSPRDAGAPRPDFGPLAGELAVHRIEPASGPPDRNVEVVVVGTGFPVGGRVRVALGEARLLEPEVLSGSTLTAIVPEGLMPGTYDLAVHRLEDEQVAILPAAYTVEGALPDLALTGVTPARIRQGELAELTFAGAGFTTETRFRVGGVLLEGARVESPTQARGTLPAPLAAGTYAISAERGDEVVELGDAFAVVGGSARAADDCAVAPGRGGGGPWWVLLTFAPLALRRRE